MSWKKYGCLLLLCCMVLLSLAGCKIEFPDDLAAKEYDYGVYEPDISGEAGEDIRIETPFASTENPQAESPAVSQHQKETAGPAAKPSGATPEPTKAVQNSPLPEPPPPKPAEPEQKEPEQPLIQYCILSVDCKTILDNMDQLKSNKVSQVPSDGVIFKARKVIFYEGETVFDVLSREMKKNRIHMEFRATPMYNSNYIEGIHNLYEFDCGDLSGWMYEVNGWYPNYGCSRYVVKEGDVIQWRYTCDLGRDLGCEWLEQAA